MEQNYAGGNNISAGGLFHGTLKNCILIGNSGPNGGGAANATLYNCTLTGNSADFAGGALRCALNNCVVYDNTAGNYWDSTLNNCCTTPMPTTGTGNITNEPAFVDTVNGNFRLQAISPCINAGNNASVTSSTDLDGNERVVGGTVDMGAYEWVAAPTHYVSASSVNPVAPYRSWSTAAAVIQDAVDVAAAGDEVVVTNGMYATGGRALVAYPLMTNRVCVDRAITLRSVNGPEVTVIQGYQVPETVVGDGAIRCVYLANGAVLSGFTLTNGAARAAGDWQRESTGGGVWCESTNALISNCALTGNSAYTVGGGAYGGMLNNCTVKSNSCGNGGGGVFEATLNNCTLTGNLATDYESYGGGAAGGTLYNCTLTGNSAFQGGGTIGGTLRNCRLTGNSAYSGGGAFQATLQNCLLTGNAARFGGGATGGSTLENCTLVENIAAMGGGGASICTLINCILYSNVAAEIESDSNYRLGFTTLNYCCTTPAPTNGVGNITNEPVFIDLAGGNLRLQAGSPCINAGNNASVTSSTDLDGRPRIAYGAVDIGAYEWSASALSGSVALEGFAGPAQNGTGNRRVSFKASDDTGRVLAAWNQELSFAGGTNGASVAGFSLTNPPPETTRLSAKTEWHLRKRLPVVVTNGQVVGNFTGASRLRAGDLDGSNLVEMEDYFLLAASWYQSGLAADLDGSGLVDIFDYFLLASHWYEAGDPE